MTRVKSVKFLRVLDDAGDALEAHAGIHVLGGQRREGAVRVGVELDEDEVPDLDALGGALVDEARPWCRPAGVRSTWSSLHGPHGPVSPIIQKLSFLLPLTMWTFGVEAGGAELLGPDVVGFLVELAGVALGSCPGE